MQIVTQAKEIFIQSGITYAIPPANVSYMEEEERTKIAAWFRSVEKQISLGF